MQAFASKWMTVTTSARDSSSTTGKCAASLSAWRLVPRMWKRASVALARRDKPGREGKSFVQQAGLAATVSGLLVEIQDALLQARHRIP